jgi:glycosyltransferase involved in cell wall biosynthesis
MRFAFVLPNLNGGGAEKAVLKTSTALAKRGHEVYLFLLEERAKYQVDPCIRVDVVSDKRRHGCWGKRSLATLLHRKVSVLGPDLLVSTLPFADEVTALAGLRKHWCRIANTLSGEISSLRQLSFLKSVRRRLRYQRLYGSRPLIAVSNGVAVDLEHCLGIESRVVTIYNPFDFGAIRAAATEPLHRSNPTDYVLHVARFSTQKRHDLLLDAWAMVPEGVDLIMLADPTPELENLIAQRALAGRVHIAGFQKNPYQWMSRARLVVLCSDYEGMPNVLIESLICGTPVVSTDCPSGPREILGRYLPSALVPCGDARALADRICDFLATPRSVSKVDLSAYTIDRTVAAYEMLAREND